MDFWRGEAYQKFFEYLDSTGGFYYEVTKGMLPDAIYSLIYRGGEMRPCIASRQHYFHEKIRSTFFETLAIGTTRSSAVHPGRIGARAGALATIVKHSVEPFSMFIFC